MPRCGATILIICRAREGSRMPTGGRVNYRIAAKLAAIVFSAWTTFPPVAVSAQTATWNLTPGSNDFSTAANWTPAVVPSNVNASTTAIFGLSNTTNLGFSAATSSVGTFQFTADAPAYAFDGFNSLIIRGLGIVNASGQAPTFRGLAEKDVLTFQGSSSAGNAALYFSGFAQGAFRQNSTAANATISILEQHGIVEFFDSATAGNANITVASTSSPAALRFWQSSSAGNAVINIGPTVNGAPGPTVAFLNNSSAAHSQINNVAGSVSFQDVTTAASATITNSGVVVGGQTLVGRTFFNVVDEPANTVLSAANATITNNNLGFTQFSRARSSGTTTAGNAQITNNAGGYTLFGYPDKPFLYFSDGFSPGTVNGTVDGGSAGNATIVNNGGNTYFTIASTAANATITSLNGGSTRFYDNSTAGSATITANSGSSITFSDNSDAGTAHFINRTGGIFDISGLTRDGLSVFWIEGGGNFFLGSKRLTVGGNNLDTTLSGVIADGGESGGTGGKLTKVGSGTLILSGINTYTGGTAIDGGTLSVNGSIATSSLATVNAGGALGGNGTVGNTTINGGTFAPGNGTPGTSMTVAGNLAFQSGALYLVQLNPATSTFANVTGTASLNGAAGAAFLAGNYVAKQYTILTAAGGVSGTFGSFNTLGMPSGFTASLSYDAHDVFLDLHLGFAPPTQLNVNQQKVANALVNFFNRTGGIPAVFASLTPAGLTQASSEIATGSQQTTFDAMNLFLGLLTDPFVAGRGNPVSSSAGAPQFADESDTASAYAANGKARSKSEREAYAAVYRKAPVMADPFTQRWSVWAAGYGGSQTTDGNTGLGSNNTRSSIGGVAVGADYWFSPNTLAGFAIAGGGTSFSVNGLGSGRSDLFQAGAFVRHNVGAAYLTGALAYGWQDITTDRTVTIAGTDVLRANFNANAFSGRVEGGYRFVTPWMAMGFTPYAAGQATTFDLPAYAEQAIAGANTFALTYGAKDVTASRSELGLRSDKSFAMQDGIFTLRGRAAWAHNFNTDRSITPTFQTLPGASFVVNGARQASDSVLVTGSAEMKWLNGFSLAGTFEGEFSGVTASYAGKGVARYSW
jgi:autotransporter-associated beta strand protein